MSDLLQQSELQGLLDKALKEPGRLRKGANLQYYCPFCQHRKRKLEICLDAPRKWHCWVCHAKGHGIKNLFIKMNVDASLFNELDRLGLKESEYRPIKQEGQRPVLMLPNEFISLAANDGSRAYRQAIRYAMKRGITPYDVIKYNLGYCTEGRWRDRIIFPSYDIDNNLNFFTGRSYYENVYLKYDNCDAEKDIIGFENMVDFNYPISLVEGPLDAIAVKRNVIPLFGTYLSNKLQLALAIHKPEVNIVLDPDAVKLSLGIAEFLLSNNISTKLVIVNGKDAGELGFAKISQEIKETDYLDFRQIMRLRLGV
jgi:DNA primase